jgi:hypothetical protein
LSLLNDYTDYKTISYGKFRRRVKPDTVKYGTRYIDNGTESDIFQDDKFLGYVVSNDGPATYLAPKTITAANNTFFGNAGTAPFKIYRNHYEEYNGMKPVMICDTFVEALEWFIEHSYREPQGVDF